MRSKWDTNRRWIFFFLFCSDVEIFQEYDNEYLSHDESYGLSSANESDGTAYKDFLNQKYQNL